MKRTILSIVVATLLPASLLSAEPSAFGAGDLDSANPYGLTKSEKVLLENKQKLAGLSEKTLTVDNKIDSLRERVDGFQSVVETISKTSHQNSLDVKTLLQTNKESLNYQNDRNNKIDQLIKANSENIDKLKTLLSDISTTLDTINKNYVSKDEYNNLVKDVNDMKSLLGSKVKTSASSSSKSSSSETDLDSLGNTKVLARAEEHFKNKEFSKAKEHFDFLISKNYKVAYANYMAGESSYKLKKYSDAISYYKDSGIKNEKASYMPTLMLHTAISMQKTKDNENAKKFLNAIVEGYSGTSEAKEAKKILSSLK
jgi:TolA-binding protein